jgi:lipopolysaccharide heptosyltransferase II
LRPAEEKRIAILLDNMKKQYAVLFVGTRWQSKQWLPQQMADCARFLRDSHKLGVILLGGKEDQSIADAVLNCYAEEVRNLVGQTSLRDALGLIARAHVAVGPDTGLMHIAAAVGTPVVSLWGATSPRRTGPYGFDDLLVQGRAACVPCYRRRCPIGHVCMKSIGANEIQAKIASALARTQ